MATLERKQEELLNKIQKLDKEEASVGLPKQHRIDRIKSKDEFQEIVIEVEIKWQQKSRINWLRNGDNNTKSYANSRKSNIRISSLIIDGLECEDLQRIENEIIE